MDFEALRAPIPREKVHWRAQTVTKKGDKALALAYIDARDLMERLDEVCGPAGWQDSYAETPKGRIICTISILCDGEWISKSDGAGDTDVEGAKGGISDAFKRTGVKWGVARELYDLGNVWAPCEVKRNKNGEILRDNKERAYWKEWTADPWNYVRGQTPPPKSNPEREARQEPPARQSYEIHGSNAKDYRDKLLAAMKGKGAEVAALVLADNDKGIPKLPGPMRAEVEHAATIEGVRLKAIA